MEIARKKDNPMNRDISPPSQQSKMRNNSPSYKVPGVGISVKSPKNSSNISYELNNMLRATLKSPNNRETAHGTNNSNNISLIEKMKAISSPKNSSIQPNSIRKTSPDPKKKEEAHGIGMSPIYPVANYALGSSSNPQKAPASTPSSFPLTFFGR